MEITAFLLSNLKEKRLRYKQTDSSVPKWRLYGKWRGEGMRKRSRYVVLFLFPFTSLLWIIGWVLSNSD